MLMEKNDSKIETRKIDVLSGSVSIKKLSKMNIELDIKIQKLAMNKSIDIVLRRVPFSLWIKAPMPIVQAKHSKNMHVKKKYASGKASESLAPQSEQIKPIQNMENAINKLQKLAMKSSAAVILLVFIPIR